MRPPRPTLSAQTNAHSHARAATPPPERYLPVDFVSRWAVTLCMWPRPTSPSPLFYPRSVFANLVRSGPKYGFRILFAASVYSYLDAPLLRSHAHSLFTCGNPSEKFLVFAFCLQSSLPYWEGNRCVRAQSLSTLVESTPNQWQSVTSGCLLFVLSLS